MLTLSKGCAKQRCRRGARSAERARQKRAFTGDLLAAGAGGWRVVDGRRFLSPFSAPWIQRTKPQSIHNGAAPHFWSATPCTPPWRPRRPQEESTVPSPSPPSPTRKRNARSQRPASLAKKTAPPRSACLFERAQLHPVPSTLLIPLAARAWGGRYFPWLDCHDAVAIDLLGRLGADVQATLNDLPTVLNVLWRTRAIKEVGRAFFAQHPQALGVNLGGGLTHYFQWLDTGANQWLDADLPEVMALRQQLLPPHGPRARHAEVDLVVPGWWQRLGLSERSSASPMLVVCEGVLMYLAPEQVQAVLAEFAHHAPPGSRLVLDVLTRAAVGRASCHTSLRSAGAEFCWGVGRMAELEQMHPRLRLLREQSVSECYGWPGLALDAMWRPWLGAPLYGLATLGVDGVG